MTGSTDGADVDVERVRFALRRMRPGCLEITDEPTGGCQVALVMDASGAGRANAAARLVGHLAAHGLCLAADDPVAALTQGPDPQTVRVRPTP